MSKQSFWEPGAGSSAIAGLLCMCLLLASCAPREDEWVDDVESHEVRGQIIEVRLDGEELVVDHEDIPGIMQAMRMSFRVLDRAETQNVQPGDSIRFRYVPDSPLGSYIEDIDVISRHPIPGTNEDVEETGLG